ncbi:glycerophosphoryl diester phosphodiesterase [Sphingomonas gellani]|uniref:glycerophosphodiester phosphodiesterase n=1 Tax=Sphingomonas gellani TaxID=1166340 RepID=A0A1H8GUI8_9SPHN|nr:glycerophosphodiester phosphodiesterase family protein [Sphingomonas gellani]SEN47673.1 glycerophosphoryl diester phosphodiesterase [Sphingomonas gellani]
MAAPAAPCFTRRGAIATIGAVALAPRVLGSERRVEVFGHRGASALRPEHTLASYEKAIADGADFIEPDLVVSKDGVLIVRHEPNIAETTDVARHPEFAGRRTEKVIDGSKQVGWFVEDFTLAELKTLRAIERLPQLRPQNAAMDGRYGLVTWQEMIDFTAAASRARPIGLVPELKHSTYLRSIGLPLEERFLATLDHGFVRRCPLVIQSFEIANLKYLRAKLGRPTNLRLMQLIDPSHPPADVVKAGGSLTSAQMMEAAGLRDVARYADILAPDTRSIIPLGPDRKLLPPNPVTALAHRAGLAVMPYTFRPENYFLAADFQDGKGPAARNPVGSISEMRAYLAAGIDGFFTDDPGLGRQAVDRAAAPSVGAG